MPLDRVRRSRIRIELTAKLVYETGLSQWNNVEVCPTTPVAEMMANVGDFPIVFE
jgi:hypothetical protein